MAFDAYFFNFRKRTNSTLAPTQAQWESGLDAKIVLLDNTSLLSPTFRLELSTPPMANATQYNYCYVPDFQRFYFIDDWSCERNLWTCTCSCDVLASFRSTILASSQYVLRSASDYDLTILDTLYPAKTSPSASMNSTEEGAIYSMSAQWGDICATVQTMGSLNNTPPTYVPAKTASGGLLYACTLKQLKDILIYMTSDITDWLDPATDLTLEASKVIFNPFEYIRAIRIYPFSNIYAPESGEQTEDVKFGFWSMSTGAYRVSTGMFQTSFHIPLTAHPQAGTRGNKMNGAPYTQRTLHFEPFGSIELDCNHLVNAIGIYVHVIVDLNTGSAKYEIKGYADATEHDTAFNSLQRPIIATGYTQMGYEIPLIEMKQSVGMGDVLPAIGKMASYVTAEIGEFIKTGEVKAPSGVGDAITAMTTHATIKGGAGTMLPCVNSRPFINSFFASQADENITDHGRPLCQRRTLSTLSGYCLCENAELSIGGLNTEEKAIVNLLNSGVYIE